MGVKSTIFFGKKWFLNHVQQRNMNSAFFKIGVNLRETEVCFMVWKWEILLTFPAELKERSNAPYFRQWWLHKEEVAWLTADPLFLSQKWDQQLNPSSFQLFCELNKHSLHKLCQETFSHSVHLRQNMLLVVFVLYRLFWFYWL